MKITSSKDHPLLKEASALSRQYMAKCNPDDPGGDPLATRKESYGIETLLSIGNVVSCMDQLYFSVDMLSGYRSDAAPEKMNRYDYVVFGIENYYLRLTSAYDRCLRLANIIFQLGLPEKQCSNDTIIKNSHIKGTPVAESLKALDRFTSPFRFHRNTVAHQGTYSDKDLDRIGTYYLVVEEDNSFERYRHLYKTQMDDFVAERKQEFSGQVSELEKNIDQYFDALYAVFNLKSEAYV